MRPKYLSRDLGQRLEGGIIFFKDEPYLVTEIAGSGSLRLKNISDINGDSITVKLNSEDIDVSSRPLGYCNHGGKAYYLTRIPQRKYKQSITHNSIELFSPDTNTSVSNPSTAHRLLFSASGYAMFMDKYPTIKTALEALQTRKASSMAISRSVALTRNDFGIYHVWYKTQNVGYLDNNMKLRVPVDDLSFIITNHLKELSIYLNGE
jgi:hypothetical protein